LERKLTNYTILVITYYGRSGSWFLHSLFDNHPDILSTPAPYLTRFFHWHERNKDITETSVLIENFIRDFNIFFDSTTELAKECRLDSMGINEDTSLEINKDLFRETLFSLLKNLPCPNANEFFIAIHEAYAISFGNDVRNKKYIVFQMHHPSYLNANQLLRVFKNVVFIHTIREPLSGFLSLFNHLTNGNVLKYRRSYIVNNIWGLMAGPFPLCDSSKARSIGVRLEDLHKDPKHTMLMLAKSIDLTWNNSLLESTFGGLKWWNNADTIKVSGFNKETTRKNRYKHYLWSIDNDRLLSLLSPIYKALGYNTLKFHDSFIFKIFLPFLILFPFKIEYLSFLGSILGFFDQGKKDILIKFIPFTLQLFKHFFYGRLWLFRIYMMTILGFRISIRTPFISIFKVRNKIITPLKI